MVLGARRGSSPGRRCRCSRSQSSKSAPRGDRLLERIEIDDEQIDRRDRDARRAPGSGRRCRGCASRPPWIFGCSVFTRPSIISGKPVTSATSVTATPASRALGGAAGRDEVDAVLARARAKSTRPVLSRRRSARGQSCSWRDASGMHRCNRSEPRLQAAMRHRRSGLRVQPPRTCFVGSTRHVRRRASADALDVPDDPDLARLAHHAAEHDLRRAAAARARRRGRSSPRSWSPARWS